jgi:hypothetical protein
MLVLEADRLTAVVTEIWTNSIKSAAIVAEHFGRVEWIDLDLGTAIFTVSTQMLEAFEVTALALPVADLILDVLERCGFAKVRDGKY